MEQYKLGNKVTAIIRSASIGTLGDQIMLYANQPYTIIKDTEAIVNFINVERNLGNRDNRMMDYSHSVVNQVTLSNVPLNERIISLAYLPNAETPLAHHIENAHSDDENHIYLKAQNKVYQVFIYNSDGELESAVGEIDPVLTVENADADYLVIYSTVLEKSYLLNEPNNIYVSLDLIAIGNTDDQTSNTYLHFDKCRLIINNDMRFSGMSKTTSLTFKVITSDEDYITLE